MSTLSRDTSVATVWQKTNGQCFYCGCRLAHPDHDRVEIAPDIYAIPDGLKRVERDHFNPARGRGRNNPKNLVPACTPCNGLKSNKTLNVFRLLFWNRHGLGTFWFELTGAKP